jgi:hypothetical protein
MDGIIDMLINVLESTEAVQSVSKIDGEDNVLGVSYTDASGEEVEFFIVIDLP